MLINCIEKAHEHKKIGVRDLNTWLFQFPRWCNTVILT